MSVAIVGHVEWFDFLDVARVPAAGEIVHVHGAREAASGGGAMAAAALRALIGAATLWCAVGADDAGARTLASLRATGLDVRAARVGRQRRAVAWLSADGERTITVLGALVAPPGDAPLGWEAIARDDGACFMSGDAAALRHARRARVLVASARARTALLAAGVTVDVLVGGGDDADEALDAALVAAARPRAVVRTEGAAGGAWETDDGAAGRWSPAPLPGPPRDAFGCGDAFAAALTAGLAAGRDLAAACGLAAAVGAAVRCAPAPEVGDLAALW